MTTKEKLLAAKLLKDAADHYGDHGCNDFEFPIEWSAAECQQFVRDYHSWNGDPQEYNPNYLHLPDFAVMSFLASKLACEVEALNASPMNPSDTPRTDAESFQVSSLAREELCEQISEGVSAEFARQLERELNAQIEANRILNLGVRQATKIKSQ